MDIVATGARLPRAGETVLLHHLARVPGGKGANQAIAVARAGGDCSLLGAVGEGPDGQQILAALDCSGVNISQMRRVGGPSGTALIMVDADGENLIGVVPGANATMSGLTSEELTTLSVATVVLLQLEIPIGSVMEAAVTARRGGATVILNAAPPTELPAELLAASDMLLVNQHEAEFLAHARGASETAAGLLLDRVPTVVVTLGADGAVCLSRSAAPVRVAAPAVRANDATAAGDTFAGYLAVAIAEHRPIDEALRRACAAASISVERPGASASIPSRSEMEQRLTQAYPP